MDELGGVIVLGLAVKLSIVGKGTPTLIVTVAVVLPLALVAVRV